MQCCVDGIIGAKLFHGFEQIARAHRYGNIVIRNTCIGMDAGIIHHDFYHLGAGNVVFRSIGFHQIVGFAGIKRFCIRTST